MIIEKEVVFKTVYVKPTCKIGLIKLGILFLSSAVFFLHYLFKNSYLHLDLAVNLCLFHLDFISSRLRRSIPREFTEFWMSRHACSLLRGVTLGLNFPKRIFLFNFTFFINTSSSSFEKLHFRLPFSAIVVND